MNEEREKIVNKLVKLGVFITRDHAYVVADFILADRKRIVEPILNWEPDFKLSSHDNTLTLIEARNETIKRAGVKI